MEDVLNSEASRSTATSFNNVHPDVKPLMEISDEDCTSLPKPKYKRYKVSFRDFPEGCGPYASRVDPNALGQTAEAVKCGQYAAKAVTGKRKKKRKRKNFYRRRVPAVRDFPPLCGPNARNLSEAESPKGVCALEDKCMFQQHMDAEQVEEDAEDGHAHKGMLHHIVQGGSEGDAVEEEKKLDVFGKRITVPEESNQDQVGINSETGHEGNGDAVQLEGTSGQEILV